MTRLAILVTLATGCASTGPLEQRVASLEQELKAARGDGMTQPITANDAVAVGNTVAAAQAPLVAFVDEQPAHCDGALCWTIENGHDNPVILEVDGQPVEVVGPLGPLIPPRSRAYIRLTSPRRHAVAYAVYDTISMGDSSPRMPLPTVLVRCRIDAYVGSVADAHWGGHTTRLDHTSCF